MEIYKIQNLTFTYPTRGVPALFDVDLTVGRGEFITLCGPSGCGKTTLLRHLKPSATPFGEKSGTIAFEGTPLGELPARDAASKIGFVLQSPENQIVTDKVWHELAFGLESLGLGTPEIRLRVAEMASYFGIQTWFHKPVTELSGGQKQLLALASIMALHPSALILDEPTSQLDPIAAGEFLATVGKINRELGVTVILTEHRLEEAFPLSTRAIVMDKSRIIADGTPKEAGLALRGQDHVMFFAMPAPMRVWAACDSGDDCPVTVRDGAIWLAAQPVNRELMPKETTFGTPQGLKPAVELEEVWFKYEKALPDVIKGLSFRARFGEITAILGGNGTGKTTALSLIAGINTPYRGAVRTDAETYTLPQNPQALFVAKTVREDLLEMLSDQKMPKAVKNQRLAAMVKLCRLDGLLDNHPYDLSGGEQQRAALAKVLLLQPRILLLDEPTKGLDAEFKHIFAAILRRLTAAGVAVIMVSHDVEFCAAYADRCALFFDGGIVTENKPRAFFAGNSFYTTSANRMARDVLPDAVTVNDIIRALG
ncbi:MAG: ATP-binding cassette domain-containing protein, partial [Peptococcaceae bacterium]|nr:ATP-binding cassette domain-containing protein [Peptococcaceae bacterium]